MDEPSPAEGTPAHPAAHPHPAAPRVPAWRLSPARFAPVHLPHPRLDPESRKLLADWWPLALGLLLLILAGVMTVRMVQLNQAHNQRVAHTLEVLGTMASVGGDVTEATSSQRGYLLTRHPAFRQRYEAARAEAEDGARRLLEMTPDNPNQMAQLRELAEALGARSAEWDTTARLADQGQFRTAVDRSLIGLELSEDFRGELERTMLAERALLTERQANADRSSSWLLAYSVGGLGLAAMLVGWSISALRQRAAQLERANDEVRQLMGGLEQRVEERTADLAEANDEMQRFAYIVSHDLRSPLVNIMGFSNELRDVQSHAATLVGRLEEQAGWAVTAEERTALMVDMPEALGFIHASTTRMERLIKEILSLSRSGRRNLVPESIDLGGLFASLASTLSAQLNKAGTVLEVGPMPEIESDRFALEQIFANLLDNAVKYRRPDSQPRIDVSAEQRDDKLRVTVADNGRGIAPEDHERVFELFRRAGAQDMQGEGIGLAHVRALARRLGGSISLESRPGAGSRFIVTLPLRLPQSSLSQE